MGKSGHDAQVAEAARLWRLKSNKTFREIREKLTLMSGELERCNFCEDSEGTDIDHFWPKSQYPERAFVWENYLLACTTCNSNYKRDRFPLDAHGVPLLIDPTRDDPSDYLVLNPTTGKFIARNSKGAATIEVCGLNRAVLERGRKLVWVALEEQVVAYAVHQRVADIVKMARLQRLITQPRMRGVLHFLLKAYFSPSRPALLSERVLDRECWGALQRCPEISSWVTLPRE